MARLSLPVLASRHPVKCGKANLSSPADEPETTFNADRRFSTASPVGGRCKPVRFPSWNLCRTMAPGVRWQRSEAIAKHDFLRRANGSRTCWGAARHHAGQAGEMQRSKAQ